MRQSVVRAAVRASSVSVRLPIVVESLEARQLLSTSVVPKVTKLQTQTILREATDSVFTAVDKLIQQNLTAQTYLNLDAYTPFKVNFNDLKSTLVDAPTEQEYRSGAADMLEIALPSPDGDFERFRVMQSDVLSPELAAQHPEIQTFIGQGIDDPTATLAMDYTLQGFHASVNGADGRYYIDPYYHLNPEAGEVAYWTNDNRGTGNNFLCNTVDTHSDEEPELPALGDTLSLVPGNSWSGATLRTYRLVMSTTPTYTSYHGGVAGAASAVATTVSRLNQVYETDFAIRMQLVQTYNFTAANTPFTDPTNGDLCNTENQNYITANFGTNYQISHVYNQGSDDGIAGSIGGVGGSGNRSGYSSFSSPVGDNFVVDYVAHEMGHQYGGRHNWNKIGASQGDNSSYAVEPGSGQSIMGYAGLGSSQENILVHSLPQFNANNFIDGSTNAASQILAYTLTATGGAGYTSATKTATGNTPPTVSVDAASFSIPISTPFELTATASDANNDALTYSWEQMNGGNPVAIATVGSVIGVPSSTTTTGPVFRVFGASTSRTRTFPTLPAVLLGRTYATGEQLPSVARTMKFDVTVRDNRVGGGGVAIGYLNITTVAGTAFSLNTFNSSTSVNGGSSQAISWTNTGTTTGAISATNVNILLSTDGGATFPITLASNVANDGSETVTMPYDLGSTTARIKIVPTNNVFFDINNSNFTLVSVPSGSATPGVPDLVTASDTGFSSTDNLTLLNNANGSSTMQFSVGSTVAGALVSVLADGVVIGTATATGTTTIVTTSGSQPLANGARSITVTQTESGKSVSLASSALSITIDATAPAAPTAPTLLASSDTGFSNSDGITNINTPTINSASTDTYYRLERDGSQISGNYATPGSLIDATLSDGTYAYRARSVDAAGNASGLSAVTNVTIDTVAPTAPTAPTLAAASDTGASSTDSITKINTPTINSTSTDSYYRLERDASQISGNFATPGSLLDTTLVDGTYAYRTRSVDAAGNASGLSSALSVTIDTVAPQLVSQQYSYLTSQSIALVFNDLVNNPALDQNSVVVSNLTTPGSVTAGDLTVAYDNGLNKLTVTWPSLPGGVLPDGNYTATLSSAVADVAGNAVTGIVPLSFYFLQGDATQDRFVDTQDFNVLAGNFGNAGTFADGNFNYDGTIDSIDFTAMVGNFGKRLAAPAPLASTSSQAPAGALFGNSPVTDSPTLAELS